jgi:hypothetical protein
VVTSLTIGSASVLDLTNNSMIIDYSGSVGTLVGDTKQNIRTGRIVSTSADATHRLGYGDNALLHRSSLGGQPADDTSLLIKFTFAGDSNLDGQVDADDLARLAQHWQQSADWTGGDLDYDGLINIRDLYLLATTWQMGVGNPLPAPPLDGMLGSMLLGTPPTVPEPTMFIGLCLASFYAFGSRRRRRARSRQSHQRAAGGGPCTT